MKCFDFCIFISMTSLRKPQVLKYNTWLCIALGTMVRSDSGIRTVCVDGEYTGFSKQGYVSPTVLSTTCEGCKKTECLSVISATVVDDTNVEANSLSKSLHDAAESPGIRAFRRTLELLKNLVLTEIHFQGCWNC